MTYEDVIRKICLNERLITFEEILSVIEEDDLTISELKEDLQNAIEEMKVIVEEMKNDL